MATFPKLILRQSKVDAVKRFHPWIFSGAIKRCDPDLQEGDTVEVYSESGEYLAIGHYHGGNIAVKILAFEPIESLASLFLSRFESAHRLRQQIGLSHGSDTNCYRLINAEGDSLPGLIIDWYNGTAVMQSYSIAMYQQRQLIVDCLKTIYQSNLHTIYDKSAAVLQKTYSGVQNEYLLGSAAIGHVQEHGHPFQIDWEEGQKTGFFLDQRENRAELARYVQGKRVLNTFCYSGGFSVYAIRSGAELVHSVDSSAKAIAWTEGNIALNNPHAIPHQSFTRDVFEFLKDCEATYDVIVLDPPAFAKGLSARHSAMMAYKRLNTLALAKVKSGGIVFTFSCSQVVSPDNFQGAVTAGAIDSKRRIRVLDHLTQPADHPTSIYHPEGLYLKGLVLQVE